MHPLFFSLGPLHIYWLSVSTLLAWLVFSFLFWRNLRRIGSGEDTTFDLTFYATLVGIVVARLGFIAFHPEIFVGKSPLLGFTLWVAPGLSWTGAFVGAVATLVFLSRRYKVRVGQVLDAFTSALPIPFCIGAVGTLLDGVQIGKMSNVRIFQYPVELYQILGMLVVSVIFFRLIQRSQQNKWPYGIVSIWFIFSYACMMFLIEFIKDSRVYFGNITANQWVYIALIAECIGVMYVRGGGREKARPLFRLLLSKGKKIGEQIYATVSRRHPRDH